MKLLDSHSAVSGALAYNTKLTMISDPTLLRKQDQLVAVVIRQFISP